MFNTSKNLQDYSYTKLNMPESRVVLRTCLNVTVDNEGMMTDATRFQESLPLIKELAQSVQNLVITAHLGRPEQRERKSSFWNVAGKLGDVLSGIAEVVLVDDLTAENIQMIHENKNDAGSRKVFMLENIRFFKGEDSKDTNERLEFAKQLASLGNTFINDAFADYRESASSYDIATLLPSYLGPVFLKEVEALLKFNNPEIPFVAIIGGAKLSEKLDALNALANIADKVVIGGAMAYTLMKAEGKEIGDSLVEDDKLEVAKEIISKFKDKLVLPLDHLVADTFDVNAKYEYTDDAAITPGKVAIDIGWKSINNIKEVLASAKTILWNGPLGVFEWDHSAVGTLETGRAIEANVNSYKLAGGGDSIAAINKLGLKGFDHISTGGGAMLAFIAYDKFPTLDVILNK